MIKLSALFLVHFFSSAQSENAICIDQSDQREYRKYLAGLIKKENMTNGSMWNNLHKIPIFNKSDVKFLHLRLRSNLGQVWSSLVEIYFELNAGKKSGRHFLRHSNCDLWSCCDIFITNLLLNLKLNISEHGSFKT